MLKDLRGQIERITYINEENGYTVAKTKVRGERNLVVITGNFMALCPGEILKMKGEWKNHPKFGEQFNVESYTTEVPGTVYGIQKYLGSGLIKGIGPVMAKRIVKKFGEKALDTIENSISRLAKVEGIGKKRISMIKEAWEAQKEIRDVMIFLQTHGVSSGYAAKIFKEYGKQAIGILKENPFRLAMDIFGIGFVTADNIAQKLGFSKDSKIRLEAGIIYVLHQLADEGHTYYPYEPLISKSMEILEADRDAIVPAAESLEANQLIVTEYFNESFEELKENSRAVFLEKFHFCETNISKNLKDLINSSKSVRDMKTEKAVEWIQGQLAVNLAEKQMDAVKSAIESKVMVITGGPGTGKTTIINAVLKIFKKLRIDIMLAAPTGRAAKKMSEATGHEAKTIHRLLEYSLTRGGFQKNDEHPLKCDLLIVDEASMIDTVLMHQLLKAIPKKSTFILVGDVNQLPSVGAGNVLMDIISSGVVPVVELNEIFRQARKSDIILNAHLINKGVLPPLQNDRHDTDFYFIAREDPEKALATILELVKIRIPEKFGFDPVEDIQVLTPMHKGLAGAENLNRKLQKNLNPGKSLNPGNGVVIHGNRQYLVNDKVMQVKNNYDKEIFNGDIGRIIKVIPENQEVVISFDGKEISYDYQDLDEIIHAYAISVHKSQGSEYPVVIIPILTEHYIMLQRNLIYTAVTRGRKLVILVGTRKALAIGVQNNKTLKRYTLLAKRIKGQT